MKKQIRTRTGTSLIRKSIEAIYFQIRILQNYNLAMFLGFQKQAILCLSHLKNKNQKQKTLIKIARTHFLKYLHLSKIHFLLKICFSSILHKAVKRAYLMEYLQKIAKKIKKSEFNLIKITFLKIKTSFKQNNIKYSFRK